MSQQNFDDIINNNEEIANAKYPTGGKWSEDGKSYSDRYGTIWRGDAANPGKLYAHIGGTEKEWSEVYGSDVPMPTYTPPTGTTGGSTPVVTPSRAAGAAPSGYGDYLAGEGKAVQQAYDQAVAAAREEYARNRATFGARAESLGRAGLTGSGYGDYLEGKAFNAMQQKIGAAETAKAQSYADYLTQKEAAASSYAAYLAGEQQAAKEKLDLAINGAITSALNSGNKYVSRESIIENAALNGVTFDEATMESITARLAAQGITVADRATVENYNNTEAGKAAANDIVNEILSSGLKTVSDEVLAHYAAQYSVPVDVNAIKGTLAGLGVSVKPQAEIDNAVPTGFGSNAISYWMSEFYNSLNSINYGNKNAVEDVGAIIDRMVDAGYDKGAATKIKNIVLNDMMNPTMEMDDATRKIYFDEIGDFLAIGNRDGNGTDYVDPVKQAEAVLEGMLLKGVPEEYIYGLIDVWNGMYPNLPLVDIFDE